MASLSTSSSALPSSLSSSVSHGKQKANNVLQQTMLSLYPDLYTRTICVPPIHINRVPYVRDSVAGQSVLVLDSAVGGIAHPSSAASTVTTTQTASTSTVVQADPSQILSSCAISGTSPELNQPSSPATCQSGRARTASSSEISQEYPNTNQTPSSCLANNPEQIQPSASVTPRTDPELGQNQLHSVRAHHHPTQIDNPLYSVWSQDPPPHSPPLPVYDCDLRDDFAQRHLLANLYEFGSYNNEVMFILSRLNFSDYLCKSSYATAIACLPLASDLGRNCCKGEFDVLLIHLRYGILIGELKSVGRNHADLHKTQAESDADVAKRVRRAAKQVNRSEKMARHLVSDVASALTVRTTLFLPYVSRVQLQRVIAGNPQLEQEVCKSLGAVNASDAAELCVCSDDLSDPADYWHVTTAVLSQLGIWWQRRMACTLHSSFDAHAYLEIVARFAGPATSVKFHCVIPPRIEIRTEGEAVAELGRMLTRLILTPQQLDLMNRAPPRVFITGPPGTGKTIVMMLMGLKWLLEGHDVDVVSTWSASLAASYLIFHQLQKTLQAGDTPSVAGTVHFKSYNIFRRESDVDLAVKELSTAPQSRQRHILMDEAWIHADKLNRRYQRLLNNLLASAPRLSIWVGNICCKCVIKGLQMEALTVPLRCAPVVLREVQPGLDACSESVLHYNDLSHPVCLPSDGLKVKRLRHHGNGHQGQWPDQCEGCGHAIAELLRQLHVGESGSSTAGTTNSSLQYRDVFVLTRSSELQDDIIDDDNNITSPASGVVLGLRDAGVPVCVLDYRKHNPAKWERDLADTAVALTDRVTVADWGVISGLERIVVVWLPGRTKGVDDNDSDEEVEKGDRLYAVSRCTTQLVIVEIPSNSASCQ